MRSIYEILAAKRDGQRLTTAEIAALVRDYTDGAVADYQMSAFLMAACVNGLAAQETSALTQAMLKSGDVVAPEGLDRPLIDKHSTGGVGDKLSLILSPLLAECGIAVGMISGRGLGHTGGTLDKFESIPGMKVFHTPARFNSLLKRHHFAIMGQTEKIAPADRKIYALRDVTGTVESIPLIVASIMSKKLALKSSGIVFDIKAGNGAFMKSARDAGKLANALLAVAKEARLPARAVISNMNQPTGRMIGNWLEVIETIEALQGGGPSDTLRLTLELAAQMLVVAKAERELKSARECAARTLASGAAYESFVEYVNACGGETKLFADPRGRLKLANSITVSSPRTGYIRGFATAKLGYLATTLGAGRHKSTDTIDPLAGIELAVKYGEQVHKGDLLATLYSQKSTVLTAAPAQFLDCIQIGAERPSPYRLILKRISDGQI